MSARRRRADERGAKMSTRVRLATTPVDDDVRERACTCSSLMTADDVAELLGMSKDWIYTEVRAGRIPHVRLGRYVRFRLEAIEDWIRASECATIA